MAFVRLVSIILILSIGISSIIAEDLTIDCLYEPNKKVFESITDVFLTCNLKSNLTATATVTEVTGEPGTTLPADVKIFEVTEVQIYRLPKGLKTVFSGLIGMKIHNTDFSFLSKDDLEEYNLLQYLEISNSKLAFILDDTFSGSSKLELIDLSANAIFYIGANAFTGPDALAYLNINEVMCLLEEDGIADTEEKITNLKTLISTACGTSNIDYALSAAIEKYLNLIGNSQKCENENPGEKCEEDCTGEVEEVETKLNATVDQLGECNKTTDSLNAKNLELNQKIEELEALTSNTGDGTCGFKTVANIYSCYAKISVKTAAEQTVNWNGTHASDKNNDAVLSMVIYSQTVEILPLNIGTVFKNLISLAVKNSGLTKIKAGDFKTLTKLETLEITGNNITTIDATAFSGLTKLIKLDLSANKITVLPSKVFDTLSLSAFKILDLSYNVVKVRYDIINAANTIEKAYFKNNTAMEKLDRTFIWRLQKAKIIDLEGTGCNYSLDKTLENPVSFMSFYSDIVTFC